MKKILLFLASALLAFSASAYVSKVYVNPLHNTAGANSIVTKRLYKKALLGLSKSKTVSVATGTKALTAGSADAANYDYILDMDLVKAAIEEAGTVGNLLGVLSTKKKTDPDWCGKLETVITITNAKNGNQAFQTTLIPQAINKDKSTALFNATNNFDYDMTDMTDDAFVVTGEVAEATEVDKKNIVKKVRIDAGSKDGTRKEQAFQIYKVVGDNSEPIGFAKCEQVLGAHESILSVNGKKDGDKIVSDLIQNNDGSYTIEAKSCSKGGFLRKNFQGIDKVFAKEGRPDYMDPFGRTRKPKIGFLGIEINDNAISGQFKNLENQVLNGMKDVTTIDVVPQYFHSMEEARKAGVDGLIEISIDKVNKSTDRTKDGKTNYTSEVLYTIGGVDAANNKWIDMKSFSSIGTSTEGTAKADADALVLIDEKVQKFAEDLFPVAAEIVSVEEVKKDAAKKVKINVGTTMGVKKGMAFDIYEQRAEGGADSRFLLGEGKVEKEGLDATEAILKVKGKNNGDVRINELMKNADENTQLILVSKATYNVLDKGLNFLQKL